MTTIVTRAGKGTSLSYTEMDSNFTNLNTAKLEANHPATQVANTPVGSITSTDVQAAINELDTKKAPKASPVFTGVVTSPQYYNVTTSYGALQVNGSDVLRFGSDTSGQLAGFRNKIINGDCTISQRGTSFPAIGNGSYCLDRWQASYTTSAVGTITQQVDAPSDNEFQSSLRYTVTTADASIAATDICEIRQHIEGYNARDLIGKTITLSFWVKSSKTGVHCARFRNGGSDRSYVTEYTVFAVNTWEKKTLFVYGGLITAGTWDWTTGIGLTVGFVLAAGTNFQTTPVAWQTGNLAATSNQVNCLDTIGNVFAITGVQVESSSIATPFEHHYYGLELALCQRYYWKKPLLNAVSLISTGTSSVVPIVHPVTMRVSPAINHTLTNANYVNGVTSGLQWTLTTYGVGYAAKTGTALFSGDLDAFGGVFVIYSASFSPTPNNLVSPTGYIDFTAEL